MENVRSFLKIAVFVEASFFYAATSTQWGENFVFLFS